MRVLLIACVGLPSVRAGLFLTPGEGDISIISQETAKENRLLVTEISSYCSWVTFHVLTECALAAHSVRT